jgi:hypothetical protein
MTRSRRRHVLERNDLAAKAARDLFWRRHHGEDPQFMTAFS